MPNVKPVTLPKSMTIRVDDEFVSALDELRSLLRPVPTKSDAIRIAVLDRLAAERKARGRR